MNSSLDISPRSDTTPELYETASSDTDFSTDEDTEGNISESERLTPSANVDSPMWDHARHLSCSESGVCVQSCGGQYSGDMKSLTPVSNIVDVSEGCICVFNNNNPTAEDDCKDMTGNEKCIHNDHVMNEENNADSILVSANMKSADSSSSSEEENQERTPQQISTVQVWLHYTRGIAYLSSDDTESEDEEIFEELQQLRQK